MFPAKFFHHFRIFDIHDKMSGGKRTLKAVMNHIVTFLKFNEKCVVICKNIASN
jgi:hypothetical protein